jgi:hypothetical protein
VLKQDLAGFSRFYAIEVTSQRQPQSLALPVKRQALWHAAINGCTDQVETAAAGHYQSSKAN